MGIAHNNVGNCLENLPQSEKNLMFFFSTSVACIINRTLRKHNTNEVKDSGIFLQTNIWNNIYKKVQSEKLVRFGWIPSDFNTCP